MKGVKVKLQKPNKLGIAVIAISAGYIGSTVMTYVRVAKQERQKRKKIVEDLQVTRDAIHYAQGKVMERIGNGEYANYEDMMLDFELEEIIYKDFNTE